VDDGNVLTPIASTGPHFSLAGGGSIANPGRSAIFLFDLFKNGAPFAAPAWQGVDVRSTTQQNDRMVAESMHGFRGIF
jgi:hypothetical protein